MSRRDFTATRETFTFCFEIFFDNKRRDSATFLIEVSSSFSVLFYLSNEKTNSGWLEPVDISPSSDVARKRNVTRVMSG